MTVKKYTLDRIEDKIYVFLEHPDEINQLLVPVNEHNGELTEGNIVNIKLVDGEYIIEVLENETTEMEKKVSNLIEKLKNKQ